MDSPRNGTHVFSIHYTPQNKVDRSTSVELGFMRLEKETKAKPVVMETVFNEKTSQRSKVNGSASREADRARFVTFKVHIAMYTMLVFFFFYIFPSNSYFSVNGILFHSYFHCIHLKVMSLRF